MWTLRGPYTSSPIWSVNVRANLTHSFVEALKPPAAGQTDYWDAKTAGFGLRISMGGTKSWLVRF